MHQRLYGRYTPTPCDPSTLVEGGGNDSDLPRQAQALSHLHAKLNLPAAASLAYSGDGSARQFWIGNPMSAHEAKFQMGQIIHHRLFDYAGVIFDIDPVFQGTEEWYEHVARSRPPKDEPWYHVLVHNAVHTTYVAEQNLRAAETPQPIAHPLAEQLLGNFDGDRYRLRRPAN